MKNRILFLALITLLASCGGGDKKAKLQDLRKKEAELKTQITALETEIAKAGGDSAKPVKAILVTTLSLKPELFKTYIDVQGKVDADENISLSSEMPGTITKINVKLGDEVSKGQVLAETDAQAIQQGISDLQTNLDLANQVFSKQKNLWDQKIGTEIQYLQAKSTKESLEKKMGSLQEQLRMSKIVSPISGTVDAVDIKLGQSVFPGLPAIRVVNFNNLKVKADLAESYTARVKKGNPVIIYFPDMNDSITGKINYSARTINTLNRTFGVEVLLDNKTDYHPNMVAKLSINDYQSASPVIVVPVRNIQKSNGETYVFIANGTKADKRIVKQGKEYDGRSEIISGLKEGDLLISAGFENLNEGNIISYTK